MKMMMDLTTVSLVEIERFAAAIRVNPDLASRYDDVRTPSQLADRLREEGYDVTDVDIVEHLGRVLLEAERLVADHDLDHVSGGLQFEYSSRRWRTPSEILRDKWG